MSLCEMPHKKDAEQTGRQDTRQKKRKKRETKEITEDKELRNRRSGIRNEQRRNRGVGE